MTDNRALITDKALFCSLMMIMMWKMAKTQFNVGPSLVDKSNFLTKFIGWKLFSSSLILEYFSAESFSPSPPSSFAKRFGCGKIHLSMLVKWRTCLVAIRIYVCLSKGRRVSFEIEQIFSADVGFSHQLTRFKLQLFEQNLIIFAVRL